MKINIGSKSPAKIKSIQRAFTEKLGFTKFAIEGYAIESTVREQPLSEEETFLGAKTRAIAAFNRSNCDLGIGIEGGVMEMNDAMYTFGWIIIWDGKTIGSARSASFELPKIIADRIRNGEELGPVNDDIFNTNASKKTKGALGCLTNDKIKRDDLYLDAVVMAYIPYLNKQLFES